VARALTVTRCEHLIPEREDARSLKRHRRGPSQAFRKVREGERMLGQGQDLTEVLRIVEVSEAT
jgi:hypothetical protein